MESYRRLAMKRSRIVLGCMTWYVPIFLIAPASANSAAGTMGSNGWSFEFKNCAVAEALSQIMNVTGIEILVGADDDFDERLVTKSYIDQSIDYIVRDILRRENHAMIWHYSDRGLGSILIWIPGRTARAVSFDRASFSKARQGVAEYTDPMGEDLKSNRVITRDDISASEKQNFLEYADPIAENLLGCLNDGDYTKFSRDFDERARNALSEAVFTETRQLVSSKIGLYKSREISKVAKEGAYTVVIYRVDFEEEKGVEVKVQFRKYGDQNLVSGVSFSSPKLPK